MANNKTNKSNKGNTGAASATVELTELQKIEARTKELAAELEANQKTAETLRATRQAEIRAKLVTLPALLNVASLTEVNELIRDEIRASNPNAGKRNTVTEETKKAIVADRQIMTPDGKKPLYTYADLAKKHGCSVPTVQNTCDAAKLTTKRTPKAATATA